MAVGRISGPLLEANLERNGINIAFETDLLYVDVNNSRIGVNNSSPTYPLDITGTSRTVNLLSGAATIDNVVIDDSLINTTTGDLFLEAATSNDFVNIAGVKINRNEIRPKSDTDDLLLNAASGQAVIINDSFSIGDSASPPELSLGSITILGEASNAEISTNQTNLDLDLRANGTGRIVLESNSRVEGNLDVTGNLGVTGNITVGGNITIGDSETDSVTVSADFTSDLRPNVSGTYDIGTATKIWRNMYVGDLLLTSNSLTATVTDSDINITPNGAGTIIANTTKSFRLPVGTSNERPTVVDPGHLRWNTTDGRQEGWDGSSWHPIPFGQVVQRFNFTATGGQTAFSGTDDNGNTFNIVAGTEIVVKNGDILEKTTDYTITNTTLTLTSGATSGDEVNVISFADFTVGDVVPASTGGTFNGGVTITGNLAVTNNATISANLIANGTSTRINSVNTSFVDRIISVGTAANGASPASDDNQDRGVNFKWHDGASAKDGFFGYDDSTGYFTFVPDATITGEVVSGTLGDIQAANFRGNLISTSITSDGLTVNGNATITGTLDVDGYTSFNTTEAIKLPVGTSAERPSTLETGQIRYNTTITQFEGYNGSTWSSLGGVVDADLDTYIQAESSPGADNDELEFFVAGTRELLIDATGLTLNQQLTVPNGGTGATTFTTNGMVYGNGAGALQVTAASNPGSNATTSYGIMTTNASNVPVWTDTIDGGTY